MAEENDTIKLSALLAGFSQRDLIEILENAPERKKKMAAEEYKKILNTYAASIFKETRISGNIQLCGTKFILRSKEGGQSLSTEVPGSMSVTEMKNFFGNEFGISDKVYFNDKIYVFNDHVLTSFFSAAKGLSNLDPSGRYLLLLSDCGGILQDEKMIFMSFADFAAKYKCNIEETFKLSNSLFVCGKEIKFPDNIFCLQEEDIIVFKALNILSKRNTAFPPSADVVDPICDVLKQIIPISDSLRQIDISLSMIAAKMTVPVTIQDNVDEKKEEIAAEVPLIQQQDAAIVETSAVEQVEEKPAAASSKQPKGGRRQKK